MISNPCLEEAWTHDQAAAFTAGDLRTLDSHLFNQPFQRAESRLAAGRAALAAEWIRQARDDFDLSAFLAKECDLEALRQATLAGSWTNLNRLKQTDPKAFECWFRAQEMHARSP